MIDIFIWVGISYFIILFLLKCLHNRTQAKLIESYRRRLEMEQQYNKTITAGLFRLMGFEIRQVPKGYNPEDENQGGENQGGKYGDRFGSFN